MLCVRRLAEPALLSGKTLNATLGQVSSLATRHRNDPTFKTLVLMSLAINHVGLNIATFFVVVVVVVLELN